MCETSIDDDVTVFGFFKFTAALLFGIAGLFAIIGGFAYVGTIYLDPAEIANKAARQAVTECVAAKIEAATAKLKAGQ